MNPAEVYRFLQLRPFQPVRVHLKDGRHYEIRFRELAIVGERWLDIGVAAPTEADAIYDHAVRVGLEHIDRLERPMPSLN